jgi:hypothetical protein
MFDEMSVRRLTVLWALRILEAMARHSILHIMPWSSCSMVDVKSRSTESEALVIFFREVLHACPNAGLVVVAAVFDMGANNIEAL